jgi:hypothetical protein
MTKPRYKPGDKVILKAVPEDGIPEENATITSYFNHAYGVRLDDGRITEAPSRQIKGLQS